MVSLIIRTYGLDTTEHKYLSEGAFSFDDENCMLEIGGMYCWLQFQ